MKQLIDAAIRNDVDAVQTLLMNDDLDVNALGLAGDSLFHDVISLSCSLRVIRAFLEAGADVNLQNANGYSVIMMAVLLGDSDLLTLLLSAKPLDINRTNPSGNTVLHYASLFGNDTIIALLKNAGADDALKNSFGENCDELAAIGS